MTNKPPNPYEILGLTIGKHSDDEIKAAFKIAALKWHPDKNKNSDAASKKFQEIKEAYDTLQNAEKKQQVDAQWKQKAQRHEKDKQMTAERRRKQEELRAKELAAERAKEEQKAEKARQEAVLRQYRQESAMLHEVLLEKRHRQYGNDEDKSVKITWKSNTTHTKSSIKEMCQEFGQVDEIVICDGQMALVMFDSIVTAYKAIKQAPKNPLFQKHTVEWATGKEPLDLKNILNMVDMDSRAGNHPQKHAPPSSKVATANDDLSEFDYDAYEEQTINRLRRAQAMKAN